MCLHISICAVAVLTLFVQYTQMRTRQLKAISKSLINIYGYSCGDKMKEKLEPLIYTVHGLGLACMTFTSFIQIDTS